MKLEIQKENVHFENIFEVFIFLLCSLYVSAKFEMVI